MEAAVEQTSTTTAGGGVDGDGDAAPKDITTISKGKRTKRQRPQSPILFTFSSTNNNDVNDSPVSSSGFPVGSTTTEDEDTAESLILLSKGQSLDLSSTRKSKDDYEGMFKFNSKRYIHTSTSGNTGIFVYECRTCNRTFPSFQALGGHRASHKKPKNNDDMRKPPPYMMVNDNNESPTEFPFRNHNSSVSLQLNNRVSFIGSTTKSSRLHECSICGTEFNSGQALGGHMRRHRVAGGGNKVGNSGTTYTNTPTLSLIPFSPMTTAETYDKKSKNNALCLDLNLPAPREATVAAAEDDQRQKRGFTFSSTGEDDNKQQPDVSLPAAPTLVDCHY